MNAFRLLIHSFLLGLIIVIMLSCTNSPTDSNKDNSKNTDKIIHLQGTVKSKDGLPLVGAVAKLSTLGYADTTNSEGVYEITIQDTSSRVDSALNMSQTIKDTLRITRDNQLLQSFHITNWIDTLPDLFIVQRDIYGDLAAKDSGIVKIVAVLTGNDISDSSAKVIELGYNTAANAFSGFVYFVYSASVVNYSVHIEIFNVNSQCIGKSPSVNFTSNFGDIQIPSFFPSNSLPMARAEGDTVFFIGDTIHLIGKNSLDTIDGIAKYEWDILNTGNFITVHSGDTGFVSQLSENITCVLRVTDSSGSIALDTIVSKIAIKPIEVSLYVVEYTDHGIIRKIDTAGRIHDIIPTGLDCPINVAIDPVTSRMYWADQNTDKIQRSNLDGSSIEDIYSYDTINVAPTCVALDLMNGKIYWTDSRGASGRTGLSLIKRANLDGSNAETIVTGVAHLYELAIDNQNGKFYWPDYYFNKIQRANLDGSTVEDIVVFTDPNPYPEGIDIDTINHKIYWTLAGLHKIQRANLDGSNIEDVFQIDTTASNMMGIALDLEHGKIYVTDSGLNKIYRSNLDGTSFEIVAQSILHNPRGVTILK